MPRTMLSSPMSSVSDELESDEHDASPSESYKSSSWLPRLRAAAPRSGFRGLGPVRDLDVPAPGVAVGHARSGGGAVREAMDRLALTVGDSSDCFGEFERALSEEPDAKGTGSVFQESRTMGGPSSTEKSHSGRNCHDVKERIWGI